MGSCADDAMYRSLCCVSRVGAREIANATCCGWGGLPSAVNTSELRRIWTLWKKAESMVVSVRRTSLADLKNLTPDAAASRVRIHILSHSHYAYPKWLLPMGVAPPGERGV